MPTEFTFEEAQEPKSFTFEEAQEAPVVLPPDWKPRPTAQSMLIDPVTGMKRESGMEAGTEMTAAVAEAMMRDPIGTLFTPAIPIPRIEGRTTLGKLAAAPVNVAAGLVQGLESVGGVLTLPLGGPAIKGVFAGLAAKSAGEQLGEASFTGDVQQAAEGVLGAGLAPAIALHRTFPTPVLPPPGRPVRTVTETTPPVPKSEIPAKPSATGLLPAVRKVGGETVVGEAGQTHPEIMAENKIPREDVDQRVFVDQATGKVLDREQAAAATPELPTATEPGRRHSTDLPEAKPPEETAAEKQAMLQEELAKETPTAQAAPPAAPAAVEAKAPVVAGAEPAMQIDKPSLPETQARGEFEVDDKLIMRSPHTGDDTLVNYRGTLPNGQAVVWTGKSQFPVPMEWLRRQGEKYEESKPTALPTVIEKPMVDKRTQTSGSIEVQKPHGDVGGAKTRTYNGYTIESTPKAVQVGYSTATQLFGKGRNIGGFNVTDPEGYTRHFDTLKSAKKWIDENPLAQAPPAPAAPVTEGKAGLTPLTEAESQALEGTSAPGEIPLPHQVEKLVKLGLRQKTAEGKAVEKVPTPEEVAKLEKKWSDLTDLRDAQVKGSSRWKKAEAQSKTAWKKYHAARSAMEVAQKTADAETLVRELHENPDPTQSQLDDVVSKLSDTDKKKYAPVLAIAARKIEKAADVAARNKRMAEPDTPVDLGHPPEESLTLTEPKPAAPPETTPALETKLTEAEKVQKYAREMVVSAANYINRSIESGSSAKDASLQWAKEIGQGLMDVPDDVYRKERGGLYTSTYVKGVFGTKDGVAVNAKDYLRAIDAARANAIRRWKKPTEPPETGPNLSVGPGAASPAEFAQRQAGANRAPPPPNPPVTTEPGEMPTPEVVRQAKDYHLFNRFNTGQWLFYFGRLGAAAKQAFEKSALAEFRMRESVMRDVRTFVRETFRELPRSVRKQGGKVFFEVLDGKTMEQVRSEWEGRPNGEAIIAQAEKVKTRLENIRTTIRDIKRDSFDRYLNAMNKDALVELFRENINRQSDISGMTKADLAHALTLDQFPDDWGISDGSYLPHLFFGQWKVTATMPGAEGAQFITRAQTIQEAKARIYEQTRANPEFRDAQFKIEQDTVVPADMIRLGDRRFWSLVAKMREQNMTQAEVKDALRGNIGRKSGREKWFGSLQERKGFEGYSKDYQRTMVAYLNGFHRWRVLTELNREVQPLIEQIRSEGRINAAQRLEQILDNLWGKPQASTRQFDAFIRRIPWVRDFIKPMALDRWARAATNLTGLLTLRTLRFSVVNRLQPLQTLYPLIGEQGIIEAKIMQHTARGRELLREAGVDLDPGQYAGEFGTGLRGREFIERFSGERSNQEVAFLGMYNHARKMGLSHQEAINYGKLRGQLMTQFTPLTVDSPEIFEGPFGRVMFQYKRFPIKTLELTSRMVADRNAPAIARIVAVLATLGGLSFFIRQTWFLDPDTRLRLKRNLDKSMGTKGGDALMYGLPGFLGADISGSITLGDEPMGKGIYEKTARMMTGPAISLGIETVKAATTPERKEASTIQQTETMLRRFPATKPLAELSSILRGDLDLRTPDGEIKLKRKLTDAIAGLGSFRSANEANISLAVNGIMALAKEESRLKNNWYMATDKPSAMKAISRFNAIWPEAAISTGDLIRYKHYRDTAGKKTDVTKTAENHAVP